MSTNVQDENLKQLTHGVELVSLVIQEIAGDEIATTMGGERMSGAEIQSAVAAKMQSTLLNNKGK